MASSQARHKPQPAKAHPPARVPPPVRSSPAQPTVHNPSKLINSLDQHLPASKRSSLCCLFRRMPIGGRSSGKKTRTAQPGAQDRGGMQGPMDIMQPAKQGERNFIDLTSDDDDGDDDSFEDAQEQPQRSPLDPRRIKEEPPKPLLAGFRDPQRGIPDWNDDFEVMDELPQAPAAQPQQFQPERERGLAGFSNVFGDYYVGDDDDEQIALAFGLRPDDPFGAQMQMRPDFGAPQAGQLSPRMRTGNSPFRDRTSPGLRLAQGQPIESPIELEESKQQCLENLTSVFPDICPDYLDDLYNSTSQTSGALIAHILDQQDKGTLYPKAKDTRKKLKRKRDLDPDEEAARKYASPDRPMINYGIRPFIRVVLSQEFSDVPMTFIDATLQQSNYRLFQAYQILEEAQRTWDPKRPPYQKIKHHRKSVASFHLDDLKQYSGAMAGDVPGKDEMLEELQASRRARRNAEARREAERQAVLEEEQNLQRAQAEGTMAECGCCFGDYPRNRMVCCNNDEVAHWFCRGCAKQNAETEIGNSKYELRCMSMDGCAAGFSLDQRNQFLDEKTIIALERNEQEAVLRMAGIENLASCPFCPFAAEYPPIEVNREFRCQAPDCEKVSCRLCKEESHIPKTCEEQAKENGLSIRRQIEEAMSAALIRKCNKCDTPFVKEAGCNKMTCTRNGCGNVQCYVCSKSCDYQHFDDRTRGGKSGNCPLFESVEQRHEDEVQKAEKEALDKVRADHPEYTEEDLKIKMSENIKQDDEKRKANDKRDPRNGALHAVFGAADPHAFLRELEGDNAAIARFQDNMAFLNQVRRPLNFNLGQPHRGLHDAAAKDGTNDVRPNQEGQQGQERQRPHPYPWDLPEGFPIPAPVGQEHDHIARRAHALAAIHGIHVPGLYVPLPLGGWPNGKPKVDPAPVADQDPGDFVRLQGLQRRVQDMVNRRASILKAKGKDGNIDGVPGQLEKKEAAGADISQGKNLPPIPKRFSLPLLPPMAPEIPPRFRPRARMEEDRIRKLLEATRQRRSIIPAKQPDIPVSKNKEVVDLVDDEFADDPPKFGPNRLRSQNLRPKHEALFSPPAPNRQENSLEQHRKDPQHVEVKKNAGQEAALPGMQTELDILASFRGKRQEPVGSIAVLPPAAIRPSLHFKGAGLKDKKWEMGGPATKTEVIGAAFRPNHTPSVPADDRLANIMKRYQEAERLKLHSRKEPPKRNQSIVPVLDLTSSSPPIPFAAPDQGLGGLFKRRGNQSRALSQNREQSRRSVAGGVPRQSVTPFADAAADEELDFGNDGFGLDQMPPAPRIPRNHNRNSSAPDLLPTAHDPLPQAEVPRRNLFKSAIGDRLVHKRAPQRKCDPAGDILEKMRELRRRELVEHEKTVATLKDKLVKFNADKKKKDEKKQQSMGQGSESAKKEEKTNSWPSGYMGVSDDDLYGDGNDDEDDDDDDIPFGEWDE